MVLSMGDDCKEIRINTSRLKNGPLISDFDHTQLQGLFLSVLTAFSPLISPSCGCIKNGGNIFFGGQLKGPFPSLSGSPIYLKHRFTVG